MKFDRAFIILIGLLYIAALFLLGVSPPMVQMPNGTDLVFKSFWKAVKETDVELSAGTFTSGATDLKLILLPGETERLARFEELKSLDATGSTNYEELRDWGQAHPEVELHYTVPLPDGQVLANTAEEVDLTGLTGEEL